MIKETWTESVRNRIVMYLINYRDHREQLEQRPYFLFEDLAVVFRVADLDDPLREQPVENADLERWNIQKEELYQYAVKNTPELFPAQVKTAEKAEDQEVTLQALRYFFLLYGSSSGRCGHPPDPFGGREGVSGYCHLCSGVLYFL